ncbi:MAG: hypothetical protein ABS942_11235 [Solibacillus sp.]|uniref:hypothetical protein n=1 Tax=Solibacillus sp. TaxID=1909654 RepID=UPI003314C5A4
MVTNKQLIQLRRITMADFTAVLIWSKDDTFCLANGWETNRDEQELNEWWMHCVTNKATDFKRIGIQEVSRNGTEHYLGMDSVLIQYEMIYK